MVRAKSTCKVPSVTSGRAGKCPNRPTPYTLTLALGSVRFPPKGKALATSRLVPLTAHHGKTQRIAPELVGQINGG